MQRSRTQAPAAPAAAAPRGGATAGQVAWGRGARRSTRACAHLRRGSSSTTVGSRAVAPHSRVQNLSRTPSVESHTSAPSPNAPARRTTATWLRCADLDALSSSVSRRTAPKSTTSIESLQPPGREMMSLLLSDSGWGAGRRRVAHTRCRPARRWCRPVGRGLGDRRSRQTQAPRAAAH